MLFDPPAKLALGLITGVAFGFLLQKGRVAKFSTILGQLLLTDWTVFKVMMTAIVVGSVGVFILVSAGWASFHIQPFLLGGVLIGAVVFGVGMAVFGYCPGTSVAASGEGSRDAMIGVVGMLTGAGIFVAVYPWLLPVLKGLGDRGKATLPSTLGAPEWLVVAGLAAVGGVALWSIQFGEKHRDPRVRRGSGGEIKGSQLRKRPLTST